MMLSGWRKLWAPLSPELGLSSFNIDRIGESPISGETFRFRVDTGVKAGARGLTGVSQESVDGQGNG